MAIDFPNTPFLNQTYTYSGRTWYWNGVSWKAVGTAQGVTGLQGNQGLQGPQGLQGIQGDLGFQGIQGIQGNHATRLPAGHALHRKSQDQKQP